MLIRFHLKLCARMSSKSFKCVSRMKLNNSLLSILKLLMIKRLSWKPERRFYILTEAVLTQNSVSQSWLCFTRQQGLTRSNVTAGSGLICGRAGREQRGGFGLDVGCCGAVLQRDDLGLHVCVREQGWLVLFLPTAAFHSAVALFAIGHGFGFCGLRLFSTRSCVTWPGDVAGVTESPVGRRFTKCLASLAVTPLLLLLPDCLTCLGKALVWVIVSKVGCRPVPNSAWQESLTSSQDVV